MSAVDHVRAAITGLMGFPNVKRGCPHIWFWLPSAVMLAGRPTSVSSQPGLTADLLRPGVEFPADFRRISSIRELSDGRVIAVDPLDDRIILIDWTAQAARDIGRKGRGPGEFLDVNRIFPLGGDSSVVEDPNSRRWIPLDTARLFEPLNPGGRFATDLSLAGYDVSGRRVEVQPFSFARGREFSATPRLRMFAESLLVVATNENTNLVDTLDRIAGPYKGWAYLQKQVPEGKMNFLVTAPFAVGDQAYLFYDGWLAIARGAPYRIDWISDQGTRIQGRPLLYRTVTVTEKMKQAFLDDRYDGAKKGMFKANEMPSWPAHLPAFEEDALIPLDNGSVAIKRTLNPLSFQRQYDIVNRSGQLVRRLSVSRAERIVGFGKAFVYTVRIDDDGLEYLRRHPWP